MTEYGSWHLNNCIEKQSFPLRISLVNVNKSTFYWLFVYIYEINYGKRHGKLIFRPVEALVVGTIGP